jgi:hypothetical protein
MLLLIVTMTRLFFVVTVDRLFYYCLIVWKFDDIIVIRIAFLFSPLVILNDNLIVM